MASRSAVIAVCTHISSIPALRDFRFVGFVRDSMGPEDEVAVEGEGAGLGGGAGDVVEAGDAVADDVGSLG